MDVIDKLGNTGIVPVVVLNDSNDAVPAANAMLAGGVNVMEITFRTSAAEASISAVSGACSDMLVGAGTVLNLEQCRAAVEAGAKFIVSPGYCDDVVVWCTESIVFRLCRAVLLRPRLCRRFPRELKVVKLFPGQMFTAGFQQ